MASPIRPPQHTMQPTEAQRRSNAIWWILGIVAAAIIFMVFCGLMVAGLFIRQLKLKNSGDKVAIETPVGSISVNGGTPHATGLEKSIPAPSLHLTTRVPASTSAQMTPA